MMVGHFESRVQRFMPASTVAGANTDVSTTVCCGDSADVNLASAVKRATLLSRIHSRHFREWISVVCLTYFVVKLWIICSSKFWMILWLFVNEMIHLWFSLVFLSLAKHDMSCFNLSNVVRYCVCKHKCTKQCHCIALITVELSSSWIWNCDLCWMYFDNWHITHIRVYAYLRRVIKSAFVIGFKEHNGWNYYRCSCGLGGGHIRTLNLQWYFNRSPYKADTWSV